MLDALGTRLSNYLSIACISSYPTTYLPTSYSLINALNHPLTHPHTYPYIHPPTYISTYISDSLLYYLGVDTFVSGAM